MRPQIHFRPKTEEMKAAIEKRAAEKGLSVNEWLNRAVTAALGKGGVVVETRREKEY